MWKIFAKKPYLDRPAHPYMQTRMLGEKLLSILDTHKSVLLLKGDSVASFERVQAISNLMSRIRDIGAGDYTICSKAISRSKRIDVEVNQHSVVSSPEKLKSGGSAVAQRQVREFGQDVQRKIFQLAKNLGLEFTPTLTLGCVDTADTAALFLIHLIENDIFSSPQASSGCLSDRVNLLVGSIYSFLSAFDNGADPFELALKNQLHKSKLFDYVKSKKGTSPGKPAASQRVYETIMSDTSSIADVISAIGELLKADTKKRIKSKGLTRAMLEQYNKTLIEVFLENPYRAAATSADQQPKKSAPLQKNSKMRRRPVDQVLPLPSSRQRVTTTATVTNTRGAPPALPPLPSRSRRQRVKTTETLTNTRGAPPALPPWTP